MCRKILNFWVQLLLEANPVIGLVLAGVIVFVVYESNADRGEVVDHASPAQILGMPELTSDVAATLVQSLQAQVRKGEAVIIRVWDVEGVLLAEHQHPRQRNSPPAEYPVHMGLCSSFTLPPTGQIEPTPGARIIGRMEVSGACTEQNWRIAGNGLKAFLAQQPRVQDIP